MRRILPRILTALLLLSGSLAVLSPSETSGAGGAATDVPNAQMSTVTCYCTADAGTGQGASMNLPYGCTICPAGDGPAEDIHVDVIIRNHLGVPLEGCTVTVTPLALNGATALWTQSQESQQQLSAWDGSAHFVFDQGSVVPSYPAVFPTLDFSVMAFGPGPGGFHVTNGCDHQLDAVSFDSNHNSPLVVTTDDYETFQYDLVENNPRSDFNHVPPVDPTDAVLQLAHEKDNPCDAPDAPDPCCAGCIVDIDSWRTSWWWFGEWTTTEITVANIGNVDWDAEGRVVARLRKWDIADQRFEPLGPVGTLAFGGLAEGQTATKTHTWSGIYEEASIVLADLIECDEQLLGVGHDWVPMRAPLPARVLKFVANIPQTVVIKITVVIVITADGDERLALLPEDSEVTFTILNEWPSEGYESTDGVFEMPPEPIASLPWVPRAWMSFVDGDSVAVETPTASDSIGVRISVPLVVPDSLMIFRLHGEVTDPVLGLINMDTFGLLAIGNESGVESDPGQTPSALTLERVGPIPSGGRVEWTVNTQTGGALRLLIADVRGRNVREIRQGRMVPGRHALAWDGRDEHQEPVPAGTYFYRLESGGEVLEGRILIVR